MSRRKYTYAVEVEWQGGWRPIIDGETRDFCLGYFASHRQTPGPRLAVRVLRSDGKETDHAQADERASLGMVAGFPSAGQYERAADRCMVQAAEVRRRIAEREARRAGGES